MKNAKCYYHLQTTLDALTETTEQKIIIGDWNAKIVDNVNRGMIFRGKYGVRVTNRNGKTMLNFYQAKFMWIGTTFWEQTLQEIYAIYIDSRITERKEYNGLYSIYIRSEESN